jgi:diguanylate cyclase (GGDEF)-like protein
MVNLQATKRLIEIIRDLCFAPNLEVLMTLVGTAIREFTHADGATFVLRDGDQCFYAHENAIAPLWQGQRFPLESCICGWAITHQQAAIIEDVYSDVRIPIEAYAPTFVKSLAVVPMGSPNPQGVIGAYWADRHRPLTQEIDLLQTLADITSRVLDRLRHQTPGETTVRSRLDELEQTNAQLRAEVLQRHSIEAELERLSLTDGLTGLYNRRGFFLMANPKLRQAREQHQPATVLFIDIDYLKQINDCYGHEAGDWLILGTATAMHQTLREGDILARVGGDEFVALVGDCTNGPELVNRLQTQAQAFAQDHELPYPLSISVGIAVSQGEDANLTLHQLVCQADAAMYAQKQCRRPMIITATRAAQG